jgi:CRP-like cAMP-binding protein
MRQTLQVAHEPIHDVFFPNGGVTSMTAVMADGSMVEVGTVGDEGFVGINALFGGDKAGATTIVQVPDSSAEVLSVKAFRTEIARRGVLFDLLQQYSQAVLTVMTQSIACMALHHIQERCCRWLLMTHDRVHRDRFTLTHEFLAAMLGSTRQTVTVIAGTLQQAGLIKYTHGTITILDRDGLEAASCECYATVKAEFDRLGL